MIQRLVLTNFMAHEHSVLELGPGLTVLTGPNNTGKSAVVEALRCVAENPPPRQHIRHGAREAVVEVFLEDGFRVVWKRRKNYPLYEIWTPGAEEPEVFAKTKGQVPEEVQKLLRMPQVHLDESKRDIDVHLGNQRYPIFLLDQPGSAFAQFFAASTEGAHLLAMQDLLKDKTREARRTVRDSEARMRRLERGLEKLESLPWLELRSRECEEQLRKIAALQQSLPSLERCVMVHDQLVQQRERLRAKRACHARLAPPKSLLPVSGLHRLLREQARLAGWLAFSRRRLETLEPLAAPRRLFPAQDLAELLSRLQTGRRDAAVLSATRSRLQVLAEPGRLYPVPQLARLLSARSRLVRELQAAREAAGRLGRTAEPPALFPLAPLARVCRKREELQHRRRALQAAAATAAQLAAPPQAQRLAPMQELLHRLRSLHSKRAALVESLEQQEQKLAASRRALDMRLGEVGACPLCGAPLDMERFLQKGRSHGG